MAKKFNATTATRKFLSENFSKSDYIIKVEYSRIFSTTYIISLKENKVTDTYKGIMKATGLDISSFFITHSPAKFAAPKVRTKMKTSGKKVYL